MAEIVVVPDQQQAGELAAQSIVDLIASRPDAVLGLATGSTPLALYRALTAKVAATGIDVPTCAGSPSTSTSDSRPTTPSSIAR